MLVTIVCLNSFGQSTLTNFKKGSLIIPMDNSKQNLISSQIAFNVKSYGLVNALLQNNIPVNWIIKDNKVKDEIDFSVLSSRLYPSTTAAASASFGSGPFIIDSLWVGLATPIILAYGNSVAVYRAELAFNAPVRYEINFKPKIAVFTNGNSQGIHTKALILAGFSSPAHFDSIPAQNVNSTSCYTFVCEPHWTNGQNAATNAVTSFLNSGGNFFAQCVGISAYEQIEHYHTTNGIQFENFSGNQTNNNIYSGTDNPLMQFEGALTNAPTGTIVNYKNNSGSYQPLTQFLVKKNPTPASGVSDGDVVMSTRKVGSATIGGNATYLGGHDYLKGTFDLLDLGLLGLDYARAGDVTWNNGLRIFYNAIFMPSARPTTCHFVFAGEAKVSSLVSDFSPCKEDTIEYNISFTNAGPGTAHNITVKTTATPTGLTYLSNTANQGTFSTASNNWVIGNLEPNTSVQLTIKYQVVSDGTYTLKAYSANLIAGNSFSEDTSSVVFTTNQSSPIVTAPAAINANTNSGCTATGINLGVPTIVDDCGIASVTNNAPSSYLLGNTTVTWTIVDKSGNTVAVTQLVTITDNENPTISTPANIIVSPIAGCDTTGLNLGIPTTADNCGVASVTNNAPTTFPSGTTTVIWTVTDNSGNATTANQTVTVTDNQNPTISAPSNIVTTTGINTCDTTGLNLGTPTTSDNCGVASVTNNAPVSFPIGTTTVIWTATDNSGNTATATQLITISDNQNPTITAPVDISTSTSSSGCDTTGLNLGTPITSDNCGVASVTNNAPTSFQLGTTTVIWTVTDNSGNIATANQIVTITDNQNPTIIAPADMTVFPTTGCDTTGLNLGIPTTADNCGVASVTNNAPTTFPQGTTTVVWTVTDNSGNTASANQTVTVTDNQNPTISAPTNISTTTNSGCEAVGLNLGTPTTSDNCGIASVTNNASASFPIGTTTVIWTVTDNSGNTASATQTITITDSESPVISNCNDTIKSCESLVSFQLPAAVDNCTLAGLNQIDGTGLSTGSHFPDGYTTLQYQAIDISGNQSNCTKVIYKIKFPSLPNAGEDQTVYSNETTLDALPDSVGIGQWNTIEGSAIIEDENDPKSRVTGLEKGNALITWTMSNEGCQSGVDTLRITYLDLNIPNAFSPDGDNVNDFFEIKGIESYGPAKIVMTNRWGEIVYESDNYMNDWNAKNKNGQELTNDTYYYQLILNDKSEFSGFVIVKRK
jgi:gliding motility-associated-like protein